MHRHNRNNISPIPNIVSNDILVSNDLPHIFSIRSQTSPDVIVPGCLAHPTDVIAQEMFDSFMTAKHKVSFCHYVKFSHQLLTASVCYRMPILCLIQRTTVTSLTAPKDTRCKTHLLCVNPGVPFWTRKNNTQVARSSSPEYVLMTRSLSGWEKV